MAAVVDLLLVTHLFSMLQHAAIANGFICRLPGVASTGVGSMVGTFGSAGACSAV